MDDQQDDYQGCVEDCERQGVAAGLRLAADLLASGDLHEGATAWLRALADQLAELAEVSPDDR